MLVLSVLVACGTGDVPTVEVETTSGVSTQLLAPDNHIPSDFGHYRWELVEAPAGTFTSSPLDTSATLSVTPPLRGIYVFDRWFVGQAADELTYHFIVTANGSIPIARIDAPTTASVGMATTFDAKSSTSAELRTLTYEWRLALRPASSTTAISDAKDQTVTLTSDVAGAYEIELRAFDGELWSQPATAKLSVR